MVGDYYAHCDEHTVGVDAHDLAIALVDEVLSIAEVPDDPDEETGND